MFMWIQTLVSVCVLVYSRPVTDAVGNALTSIPRSVIEESPPPVLLSQTRGAIYLKAGGGDSCDIWCNTTENNEVSWLYYDPVSRTTVSLANDFAGYRLQQQRGIQVHTSGNHGNVKLHLYDQLGSRDHVIQCTVSNSHGAIFGDRVRITHKVFHVSGSKRLVQHAAVGGHVTLSCSHVVHVPSADDVVWEFTPAGRRAHSSELLDADADDVLCTAGKSACALLNVTPERAGNYRCYFHREAGTKYVSHDLYVHVTKAAPERIRSSAAVEFLEEVSSPARVEVRRGDAVTLQCAFIGADGAPAIRWRFARPSNCAECAGAIRSGRKHRLSKRAMSLTISHVSERDVGAYQCSLDNGRYVSTYEIHVRLVAPPVLARPVDQTVIRPGANVTFVCATEGGRSTARVSWWRNLDPLPSPDNPRFVLSDNGESVTLYNATKEDTCSLTCNVSNADGHVLGYRHVLVVEGAPVVDTRSVIGQLRPTGYDDTSLYSAAAATAESDDDDDVMADQNMSVTLRVAHFNILWKELRTLEQRIEILEDRLNSCLILKIPDSQNVVPQLVGDDERDAGSLAYAWPSAESGRPLAAAKSNDLPGGDLSKHGVSYNIEIRFVRNVTNDVTPVGPEVAAGALRHADPGTFSAMCSPVAGCRLFSSTPIHRPDDDNVSDVDVSAYVDDDDVSAKKHLKRRRHRSSRFKFADEKQEVTHNIEQRETYINDRLRTIRVRYIKYRIIQHGHTTQTKTLWAETYSIDISESGGEGSVSDPDLGNLELLLTFRVEKPVFWDLRTKVKVDIARDYVTGGERCLFRRDFYEWRVHYSNMDALTCHVV